MGKKFAQLKNSPYLCTRNVRDLAQLVAHTSGGREVAGSSPVIPTSNENKRLVSTAYFRIYPYYRIVDRGSVEKQSGDLVNNLKKGS